MLKRSVARFPEESLVCFGNTDVRIDVNAFCCTIPLESRVKFGKICVCCWIFAKIVKSIFVGRSCNPPTGALWKRLFA